MTEKVSILIPMYNSEKYISDTIESCLAQTYENIEIIIVDDGSTDASLTIAKEFSEQNENIKVFSQPNSGAPKARNLAFSLSVGKYVVFLDSDDLLHPENIERQVKTVRNANNLTVSFGEMCSFHNSIDTCTFHQLPSQRDYENPIDYILDEKNFGLNTTVPFAWMIPENIVKLVGGWNENLFINQDTDFIYRVILTAEKLLFSAKAYGYYRLDNAASISRQVTKTKALNLLRSNEDLEKIFLSHVNDKRTHRFFAKCYKSLMYHFYPDFPEAMEQAYDDYKRINIPFVYVGGRKFKYLNKILPTKTALFLSKKVFALKEEK